MGMIVKLPGELRGMGRTAPCDVVAISDIVSSPSDSHVQDSKHSYTDCAILDAPEDLPDGSYTVLLGDQELTTRKHCGIWLTCRETEQQ